jgi:hypothetical protein
MENYFVVITLFAVQLFYFLQRKNAKGARKFFAPWRKPGVIA